MASPRDVMMQILTRQVRPVLRELVEERFYDAKEWLLEAVHNHPISQDINSHSSSSMVGGGGTLYGFIGFDSEEQPDPVGDLISFLDENIHYTTGSPKKGTLFSSTIAYPAKTAFNDRQFQLDWISRGWPLMIEEGISGLPYYLNKGTGSGRSEEGIQAKNATKQQDWKGVNYLTDLMAEFRKRLLIK